MSYYKVLSKPNGVRTRNYKGLYRYQPFPKNDKNKHFIELWQRYCEHYENDEENMGITTELTIEELVEFAELSTRILKEDYEVIFFSEMCECPHQSDYYGIDVTGFGGYSMVGENFFRDSDKKGDGAHNLYDILNRHFRPKLNSYGLFNSVKDADSFLEVLNELADFVENEIWRIVHIFRVIAP